MEKETSFIEISGNVVTLKVISEGRVSEKSFNSSDLQRLRVHETLLKDYYRDMMPRCPKVDPFDIGDF